MQSTQVTLTTEFWLQTLKPTYLHYVTLCKIKLMEGFYFLTGVKNSGRIIDIKAVGETL